MGTLDKRLDTLAGETDDTRILLVQVGDSGEVPTLELRMQRHGGDSLGWVTHRRIRLAPGQIGQLKDAINLMDPDARETEIDHERERQRNKLQVIGEATEDPKQSSG